MLINNLINAAITPPSNSNFGSHVSPTVISVVAGNAVDSIPFPSADDMLLQAQGFLQLPSSLNTNPHSATGGRALPQSTTVEPVSTSAARNPATSAHASTNGDRNAINSNLHEVIRQMQIQLDNSVRASYSAPFGLAGNNIPR